MRSIKSAALWILVVWGLNALAQGDVCDIRPDLCNDRAPAKKHSKARKLDLDFEDFEEPKSRQPANTNSNAITYEYYLRENANHPAIARRQAIMKMNQQAFIQPTVKATIIGLEEEKSTQSGESTTPPSSTDKPDKQNSNEQGGSPH